MQHKGVIQPLMRAETRLAAQMVILLVNLRGLRKTGLLLMHRLRHKNARIVFIEIQQQRRAVSHHRDKLLVTDPRRVKQDVIAEMADFIDHLARVIHRAVIGAQLDHRQAERARRVGFFRRRFADQLAQVGFIKAVVVDAADKAERVARGFQIDRRCPGLDQRTMVV